MGDQERADEFSDDFAEAETMGRGLGKKEELSKEKLGKSSLKGGKKTVLSRLLDVLHTVFVDSKALKTLLVNFLLAYNVRAGVALLLRILTLLVKRPRDILSFNTLLGEGNLSFRVEAVRIGLFVGGFSAIYQAVNHALAVYFSSGKHLRYHSAIAGFFAGLSLKFMDVSWHRTLALYMGTRMAQCFYNFAKVKGYFNFPRLQHHGDSILFILSSAQIMYAYVMRPGTLPASYYKFIVRQGPIDEVILQAVRDNNRAKPVNLDQIMNFVQKQGGEDAVKSVSKYLHTDMPKLVPIRALHPFTSSSAYASFLAFVGTAKRIFPVYLSLALVPAVVLRFKYFVREPGSVLLKSILSAIRSTTFLAGFCGSYQAFICIQRFFAERLDWSDHKLVYYLAGVLSSFSIYIERKSRRSELALYALPRALDSLYMILYDHQWAFRVPEGELLLFCISMSSVMWFYDNETACLSPLVAKLLDRFLPKTGTKEIKIRTAIGNNGNTVKFTNGGSSISSLDSDDDKNMHGNIQFPHSKSTVSLSGYTIVP